MSTDVETWKGRQTFFEVPDGPIIPMAVFAPYIEDEDEANRRFLKISELQEKTIPMGLVW